MQLWNSGFPCEQPKLNYRLSFACIFLFITSALHVIMKYRLTLQE